MEHEPIDVDAMPDRVLLPRSGLNPVEGQVYRTIRSHFTKSIRDMIRNVVLNKLVCGSLGDIAKVAETADKTTLLTRYDESWFETIESAMEAVETDFKGLQRALKCLKLTRDIEEFKKGPYARAAKRYRVAKSAKKMIVNLIDDLQNHLDG